MKRCHRVQAAFVQLGCTLNPDVKGTTTKVAGMKDNLYTSKVSAIRAPWTLIICSPPWHKRCVFTKMDPGWPGLTSEERDPLSSSAGCRREPQRAGGLCSGLKGWRACEVAYDLPIWLGCNVGSLSWGGRLHDQCYAATAKDSRLGEEGQVLMGDKGSVVQALKSRVRCVGDESKLAAHTMINGAVRYQKGVRYGLYLTPFWPKT